MARLNVLVDAIVRAFNETGNFIVRSSWKLLLGLVFGSGVFGLQVFGLQVFGAVAARPNVVVIFVDDLGYCDTELYGCDEVPTPNIKRLAEEGVLFTDGYVSSPVCSPSRAGLLTGRHQQRFGHEFLPLVFEESKAGLPVGEVTLADAMKEAGYVTGMVGKWHLGSAEEFHPINRGFDEHFGMEPGATDYIDPTREDVRSYVPPQAQKQPTGKWEGRSVRTQITRGMEPVIEEEYLTKAFTREAVAFIEKHQERPFFLYLPYTAVHGPLQVTKKYYDRFPQIEDEARRIYAAMTSALDDGIGEVLDALEENGLEENTMVVFLSDNGAGVAEYCTNEPLRMGKQTMFEGGVRIPYAIKWPAGIPKGATYHYPVSSLDVFPTALSAAGGKLPEEGVLDGVDLVPYLTDAKTGKPHEQLYWRAGKVWAIRDDNWKLIHAADRNWLYDLDKDIGEINNLVEKRPDMVERLTTRYEKWNKGNIEPLWPAYAAKDMPEFAVDGVPVSWPF